jgi:hypothetical protein
MEKLKEMIMTMSINGTITCSKALEIASRLDLNPAVVGKTLNEMKIKIKGCQLGCF